MEFIGRKQEMDLLNEHFESNDPFVGVVYGRRRVGKSRLLQEFIKNKDGYVFEGLEGEPTSHQITHFREQLSRLTNNSLLLKLEIPNWNRAFDILTDYLARNSSNKKTVVVFDEIQWMAVQRTQLMSLIKFYWDNHWKKLNVVLLLCGSVASFMVKKVIKSRALYGRINLEIMLRPLNPKDTAQFIANKRSKEEILLYQMILGRIPKYFEYINPQKSLEINLNHLCFQSNGALVNEIEKIFYSQFKKTSIYHRIIKCLFSGQKTLNEISQILRLESGGGLKEYLVNLELAEYIGSEVSLDKKINSKYKKYFLADEFLIFFKKYMEPNYSQILKNTNRNLFTLVVKPNWNSWLGLAFERFCINNAEYISQKLGFKNQLISFGPYVQKNPDLQIDLIFKLSDKVIVICEMKYYKNPISMQIIPEIQSKIDKLRSFRCYTIEKALIAPYGADSLLKKTKYFNYILTIDELF